ncbi:response regulator [Ramlibacter albus]|uniref:Response regulator n=1 Tax=Ramlibacter albus TaxID=2079448 RepID=A0A923M8U5_9BURK|nr:response regulator [Ramlibacter albus]
MSIRVFLVEDTRHMQGVLHDLLNVVGTASFEIVATRTTEAEANLWLDEHPGGWDLALVDLILEQGTGMGVIPRARKAAPGAPVVVLSDYATPGIRQHCIKLGADAVFQKSQDMQAFIDYCASLVDREPAGV